MRRQKMQLTLMPSKVMDKWARNNEEEHNKIRLSKRARMHYKPSDWGNARIKVHGNTKESHLVLSTAPLEEVKKLGPKNAKKVGFVTTKTFNYLMDKPTDGIQKGIWISENAQTITVGCDPEFVLIKDSGELQYADNVSTITDKWAPFGSDGPCMELRPGPSQDVSELVKNMKSLFQDNAGKIEQFKWLGGASYGHQSMSRVYYIGGHMHFGLPKGNEFSDVGIQLRVGRILDELVAVPLIRMDTPQPSRRRTVACDGSGKIYGAFGDTKGGDYKFEWRVPSGIWLIHPDLSHCILSTSKAVVEEVWRRFEDSGKRREFMMGVEGKDNLQSSFDCRDSEEVRTLVNLSKISDVSISDIRKIHIKLKGMATYSRYKSEIDEFIKLCCSKSMPVSNKKLDLKPGWLHGKTL